MASETIVRSGTGNFSYTNTSTENQRIYINWMLGNIVNYGLAAVPQPPIVLTWDDGASTPTTVAGRTGSLTPGIHSKQLEHFVFYPDSLGFPYAYDIGLPNEIMLASGKTFTATCRLYNIAIIPEGVPENGTPSQVISGNSNPQYTNNTGKNVRLIINYMRVKDQSNLSYSVAPIILNWAGISHTHPFFYISKYINYGNIVGNVDTSTLPSSKFPAPSEILLAPNQTFSAVCGSHNIVVIPE